MQIGSADFSKKPKSSLKLITRVKAIFWAVIIQCAIAGLIFLGGLLDPYLGLLVVAAYFFGFGFYLLYHYLMVSFSKKQQLELK